MQFPVSVWKPVRNEVDVKFCFVLEYASVLWHSANLKVIMCKALLFFSLPQQTLSKVASAENKKLINIAFNFIAK